MDIEVDEDLYPLLEFLRPFNRELLKDKPENGAIHYM